MEFVYPIDYNRKIHFWPIKSRQDDPMTLFWIFTWGVHKSHIGPLRPVVSNLSAYSGENPLISIGKVYCCCDLDRGQTDLVDEYWVGLQ